MQWQQNVSLEYEYAFLNLKFKTDICELNHSWDIYRAEENWTHFAYYYELSGSQDV